MPPGPEPTAALVQPTDEWDLLHSHSHAGEYWTRSNLGEAMPGVLTPLCWTFWGPNSENASRGMIYDMGLLTAAERQVPDSQNEWTVRPFFGRVAWQVDYFAMIGDRMPGTTAEQSAASVLGRMPENLDSHPTKRFYPRVAMKMPVAMATTARAVRTVTAESERWYRTTIPTIATLDLPGAQDALRDAQSLFRRVLLEQGRSAFVLVMPLYDLLDKLVKKAGVGDVGTLSGSGGAEVEMLKDLWQAAHGQLPFDEVLLRHGFHGPNEGELSSRPWRDDPAPLKHLLAEYAHRDQADSPAARDERAQNRYADLVPQVLAAFPSWQRPGVKFLLDRAAKTIPLRGVLKRSMLRTIDVARAAARRIGMLRVEAGELATPDDIFFLTLFEATEAWPANARELIAKRRERDALYNSLALPVDWSGIPTPVRESDTDEVAPLETVRSVTGIGVSPGVAEGRARVLTSTDFETVEDGEILVAPTTDPSWAAVMVVSGALVVDIGGALSHAAVVAREMAVPCVVNTRTGTTAIRTGDLVRVDGGAGTVQIIERATPVAEEVPQ